jgi:hypothetical protein
MPTPPTAIDIFKGTPGEFQESMWKEYAGNWKAGGENTFNQRTGEASLVGIVPEVVIPAALRYFLGYNQVQLILPGTYGVFSFATPGSGIYTLNRKNPIRHPLFEKLWCSGASYIEFVPVRGRTRGGALANFPGLAGGPPTLKVLSNITAAKTPAALQNRTGYALSKLMLRFSPVQWSIYEDDAAQFPYLSLNRAEYMRNVVLDTQPRIETFEPKISWKFAEGSSGLDPTNYSDPLGSASIAERPQILVKVDVGLTWRDVPARWILGDGGSLLPGNIMAGLGCVNVGRFLGYDAGTLLFIGLKLTRYSWVHQVPSLDLTNLESEFQYDVEFLFSYFNPTKGFTLAPGGGPMTITSNLGHNNFVYRGSVTPLAGGKSDKQQNLWFLATIDGTTTGGRLFRSFDYRLFFDSPLNSQGLP